MPIFLIIPRTRRFLAVSVKSLNAYILLATSSSVNNIYFLSLERLELAGLEGIVPRAFRANLFLPNQVVGALP